jgi:hypothetical protein
MGFGRPPRQMGQQMDCRYHSCHPCVSLVRVLPVVTVAYDAVVSGTVIASPPLFGNCSR